MITNYFWNRRKKLRAANEHLKRELELSNREVKALNRENSGQRKEINSLHGKILALQDDVSIAGQRQIEIQVKMDDLRLSVKGIRKACFRFLALTEDPVAEEDPAPPTHADHLDDLRDMIGVPRDGSQVLRGDPRKAGRPHVKR